MEQLNGRKYVTTNEIISSSRNATYNTVINCIQHKYFRGACKAKDNQKYWLVPLDIANDFIYIMDHQKEMVNALLLRVDAVKHKYGVNVKQIFTSVGLDPSLVSKYKTGKIETLTYRTIYKLCQGPVGLHCRISTLVKIAQDNANTPYTNAFSPKDYNTTKSPNIIELENIVRDQADMIQFLKLEIDRLKYISKISKRKLKKYNALMSTDIDYKEE